MPAALALVNLGTTEVLALVLLYLVFFGADKLPQVARAVGRTQARWAEARRRIARELRTEEERALDDLRAFEAQREAQIRSSSPAFLEERGVREAARALGVANAETAPLAELKREIATRVGDASGTRP